MIHIICVKYKSHFSLTSMFLNIFEAFIQKSPNDCPLIVLGHFNIDNNHKNSIQQLIDFMNKLKLKSQFKNITTKARLQIDDI